MQDDINMLDSPSSHHYEMREADVYDRVDLVIHSDSEV